MRILMTVVIGLGILIVAAGGLLAYGILAKTRTPGPETAASIGAFGTLGLDLPEKCAIKSVAPAGNILIIHTQSADLPNTSPSCDQIIVVDLTKGLVLGTVLARQGPAPARNPRP